MDEPADRSEKPTITADPDRGDQVLIHFPEFGHLDTQVWSADLGIPAASLPALRDAIAEHMRGEEAAAEVTP